MRKAPHSWGFLFVGGWVDLNVIQLLSTITKYRFFFFIAGYFLLMQFGYNDLAIILFFIAILDLAHIYQKDEKKD